MQHAESVGSSSVIDVKHSSINQKLAPFFCIVHGENCRERFSRRSFLALVAYAWVQRRSIGRIGHLYRDNLYPIGTHLFVDTFRQPIRK